MFFLYKLFRGIGNGFLYVSELFSQYRKQKAEKKKDLREAVEAADQSHYTANMRRELGLPLDSELVTVTKQEYEVTMAAAKAHYAQYELDVAVSSWLQERFKTQLKAGEWPYENGLNIPWQKTALKVLGRCMPESGWKSGMESKVYSVNYSPNNTEECTGI